MFKVMLAAVIVGVLASACDVESEDGFRRSNRGMDPDAPGAADGDPTQPGSCQVGVAHVGLGKEDFVANRGVGALGADRRRIKPYSAMGTELKRVLGQSPASLTSSAAAFGDVPARWYVEPVAGAVTVYTTYSVAFTACYDAMGDAAHAQAPTDATAKTECTTLQRKAWQRSPTPEETAACVTLAVTKRTSDAPRRRWAHTCAAIMTSAGFTTY